MPKYRVYGACSAHENDADAHRIETDGASYHLWTSTCNLIAFIKHHGDAVEINEVSVLHIMHVIRPWEYSQYECLRNDYAAMIKYLDMRYCDVHRR